MKIKSILLLSAVSILLCGCRSTKETIYSPDGNIAFTLNANEGKTTISLSFKSKKVIENSPVGIEFSDGYFGDNVIISHCERNNIIDDYDLVSGKASHIRSESNEAHLYLEDETGRKVELFLRAFNDAVAYRFYIPRQKDISQLEIKKEVMDLKIPDNPVVKAMSLPNFTSSHENYYTTKELESLNDSILFDMPALISFPTGEYMAITESNVVDYAGMMLTTENATLKGILSPRHDNSGLCVTGELPRRSPWRVFQVSNSIGTILESNVITTLADPCKEKDLSWLEPGLSTWPWWNCYQAPENLKKGDINTINQNINRYYIDFCADNKIEYHSITGIVKEDGNEICWYYNENSRTGVPQDSDDTSRPYKDFDIESISKYANDNGVGLRVWVHWKTLNQNIEETFSQFNKWGIRGMMVDYMDRDDEEMIDFQKKVLELAMKHHLHIQFHGASKPSGLNRTYPCELTRENTKNYECYKWGKEYSGDIIGSEHDLDVAFTRTLAGPSDYHLGSFRAVRREDFSPVFDHPTTTSTRAHSLAMYLALESGLQLVSDAPEAYREETGFDFIKEIPTAWDESHVILAEVDKYLVIARRKGDKWYMGAIGNSDSRDLSVPLKFLGEGKYSMVLYKDAMDSGSNLNHIDKVENCVFSESTIDIHLAPNGGFAASLSPVD